MIVNRLRTVNPEQVAAFLRTIGQMVGAGFVAKGVMTTDDLATMLTSAETVLGGLFSLVLMGWGIFARRDTALVASAANVPVVKEIIAAPEVAASTPSTKVVASASNTSNFASWLVVVPLLGLLLGACVQQPGSINAAVTGTTPAVVVLPGQTRADVAIANASEELVRYCGLLRGALAAGHLFVTKPSHTRVLVSAQTAVQTVCDQPPVDVHTALVALTNAYRNVVAVRQQAI